MGNRQINEICGTHGSKHNNEDMSKFTVGHLALPRVI